MTNDVGIFKYHVQNYRYKRAICPASRTITSSLFYRNCFQSLIRSKDANLTVFISDQPLLLTLLHKCETIHHNFPNFITILTHDVQQ